MANADRVEESAGGVLVHQSRLLLIRVRAVGFEIPKGHIEPGEAPLEAAERELREEAGLLSTVGASSSLGELSYEFESAGQKVRKRVRYFAMLAAEPPTFAPRPRRTRELRWVDAEEAARIELVSEDLRPILSRAFEALRG